MRILSFIIVTGLMALAGCSADRAGMNGVDTGMYAVDGDVAPDTGSCPVEGCGDVDAGQVDSGLDAGSPDVDGGDPVDMGPSMEDAEVDGMIVMDDAGTDAGPPPDAGPSCPVGVYSAVTGHCYRYVSPDEMLAGTTCATLGMESAWWATTAEEDAVRALPGMFPLGNDATDLNCPNWALGGTCSHGEYTWTHHPGVTPVVMWAAGTPASGTGAGLRADGMHAFTGGPVSSGGYLCQSL